MLEDYGFARNQVENVWEAARMNDVMSGCSGVLFEGQSVAVTCDYLALCKDTRSFFQACERVVGVARRRAPKMRAPGEYAKQPHNRYTT